MCSCNMTSCQHRSAFDPRKSSTCRGSAPSRRGMCRLDRKKNYEVLFLVSLEYSTYTYSFHWLHMLTRSINSTPCEQKTTLRELRKIYKYIYLMIFWQKGGGSHQLYRISNWTGGHQNVVYMVRFKPTIYFWLRALSHHLFWVWLRVIEVRDSANETLEIETVVRSPSRLRVRI